MDYQEFLDLCKMIETDPKWKQVKEDIQKSVDSARRTATLEQAKEQVERFEKR